MHNNVVVGCMDGEVSFTIYQTPLVEDHQDPGLQREYTPTVPKNDGTRLPASVPLRLLEATEATKWKPATKNAFGADYLVAVKNGHGIAIRAHDVTESYHYRVKILAGGVNVASPPPFKSSHPGTSYPDYFVMPDQQWVFGVRVGESSVRQFRVVESETRFSLKSLYERREDESIEIQITGYRRDENPRDRYADRYADLSLTAATRTPGGYTIFVTSMSGKMVALEEMASSDTVMNLKLRIREEEGTQLHKQRIIFNGKQLEDERTLSDYGIFKEATVHLVMQLSGGGGIMSALSDLSGAENAETSLKPGQLGPGGRIHQDFTIDLEPESWRRFEPWTMRFYIFDADQFETKTGLHLDPADNVERQYQVDDFVQDRFPSFRGKQEAVSIPSIAQLYRQFKGEGQQDGRNLDCAQDEQDAGQQGDANEEVDPEQQTSTPTQKKSWRKRLLSTLMCGGEW
ncbi:hypothetical protein LCI18_002379 [Fusarium solani-melongenae]|uniref:Uncharacterized protein n=1 Tax=Fusarium solani subsp. cucurbitae TaxID=2747967 RepID=A0ACD3YR35_FUSSC|nr:hypothetical protein LCI18_002379 [Fusarium solani-melongenae]